MHTIKKLAEGTLWGATIFLLFIVGFQNLLEIPTWLRVAGRMHPMFLHFPIVLLLMSFLSVWVPSRDESLRQWLNTFRLVAALSAVITAIMGLLLSLEQEGTGSDLQWHKWSGIAVALCGFVFYTFYTFFHKKIIAGRVFTIVSCGVIMLAGHLGASLTHGANYLLEPLAVKRKVPVAEAIVYDDIVKPVLEARCFSCHSKANEKGGLVLDNKAGMLAGGKTGPLFVPGDPAVSLILQRIHMPPDNKKHMPPRSKAQLTEDEVKLLEAWVRAGALLDKKLTTLPVEDTFRILASHVLGEEEQVSDQPVYTFPPADNKTISSLSNNFRVLEQAGATSPALTVHFYGKEMYSAKALEELLAIKQQVVNLSLARMPVTDDQLKLIAQMPNLEKLNLNYTNITGKGLEQLANLKNLQELALSGTAVNITSLDKVLSLPQLRSVYVWNTAIDSTKLTGIVTRYPKVRVETGFVDSSQVLVNLSPPAFSKRPGIIDLPLTIELKHPFKGVEIRYTTNGSVPDSVNSPLYKKPLSIDSNTTMIARAFKKGWKGSSESRASYIIRGIKPDSIELVTPLDARYNMASTALLTDGDLGDLNLGNGEWLAYQKNDAVYYFHYKKPVTVRQVLLNMLRNTGAAIFPPAQLEIWGGPDKDHLAQLAVRSPVMPLKNEPATLATETISFDTASIKVLKIVAKHVGKLPSWHSAKNKPGWVFISEVVVN